MKHPEGSFIPGRDQLRAARAWLDWTLDDAAEKSGVHKQTISRIEGHGGSLSTYAKLARAYEAEGIEFGPGTIKLVGGRR